LEITIGAIDGALADLAKLRRDRAEIKERRRLLAQMIERRKYLTKLVKQGVGRHIRTADGSPPEQWMLGLLTDVDRAVQIAWLYYRPSLDNCNLAEEDRDAARLRRRFAKRVLLLSALTALAPEPSAAGGGATNPRKRGQKKVVLKNGDRDEWVARQRAKKPPVPWEEIYDDATRLAPKRKWLLPRSWQGLEQALRRHLKRQREQGKA
jgi:hypothetical protein